MSHPHYDASVYRVIIPRYRLCILKFPCRTVVDSEKQKKHVSFVKFIVLVILEIVYVISIKSNLFIHLRI